MKFQVRLNNKYLISQILVGRYQFNYTFLHLITIKDLQDCT